MTSFFIIITALFVQMVWLWTTRKGRKEYIADLTSFRSPSGRFSRYYQWTISKLGNALADAVIFEIILVIAIAFLLYFTEGISAFWNYLPIIIFVVILSSLSSLQVTYRVRKLLAKENQIVDKMESAEHKIDKAREIIDGLKGEGPEGDGRDWFALYKISQRADPIGYSVRDVLMEMQKEAAQPSGAVYQSTQDTTPGDVGPDIQ
ncbi:hypothetical protein EU537_09120 [Candidatus Thorarchaeota archaeon]|nr:MAG: hypothetical protein EU537_09120 [Candidatus Thorarchaeota archaeon]